MPHKMANATCSRCGASFSRRAADLLKFANHYCGLKCRDEAKRTGRTYVTLSCAGCGVSFQRMKSDSLRAKVHYCTRECSRKHCDYRRLGLLASQVKDRREIPIEVRQARSRLGGLARAAVLSKEQLRAIAAAGVAARREKHTDLDRRRFGVKAAATRRFGSVVVLGVRVGRRVN